MTNMIITRNMKLIEEYEDTINKRVKGYNKDIEDDLTRINYQIFNYDNPNLRLYRLLDEMERSQSKRVKSSVLLNPLKKQVNQIDDDPELKAKLLSKIDHIEQLQLQKEDI